MSETIELESIRRLDIKPGETLVVRFDQHITDQFAKDAKERIRPNLPDDVKLLVLGPGIELEVVAGAS